MSPQRLALIAPFSLSLSIHQHCTDVLKEQWCKFLFHFHFPSIYPPPPSFLQFHMSSERNIRQMKTTSLFPPSGRFHNPTFLSFFALVSTSSVDHSKLLRGEIFGIISQLEDIVSKFVTFKFVLIIFLTKTTSTFLLLSFTNYMTHDREIILYTQIVKKHNYLNICI